MKKILILLFLTLCPAVIYASSVIKPDSVVRIHDGDTFTINIAGCPDVLCRHIPVRINGIDAPEIRGKCVQEKVDAKTVRQYLSDRLLKAKTIELYNVSRDKYFRINADVFLDGDNIGSDMIRKGLVRPYAGGKRGGWCS